MGDSQDAQTDEWACLLRSLLDRPVPPVTDDVCEGKVRGIALSENNRDERSSSSRGNKSSSSSKKNLKDLQKATKPPQSSPVLAPIQNLPADTTSLILSHLHPSDLFNFSLTSKRGDKAFSCELLWRSKFLDRWNCPDLMPLADEASIASGLDMGDASGVECGFWKQAYISAHKNTHDLWVRHWNCCYPDDFTTGQGRTVIPAINLNKCNREWGTPLESREGKQEKLEESFNSASLSLCPSCRYHPMIQNGYNSEICQMVRDELSYAADSAAQQTEENDPVYKAEVVAAAHSILGNRQEMDCYGLDTTTAKTIHYSTMYSVAKWCRNVRVSEGAAAISVVGSNLTLLDRFHNQLCSRDDSLSCQDHQQKVRDRATYAFECASTYNRIINTDQYNASGLNFLTDALFFNIHQAYKNDLFLTGSWRSKMGHGDTVKHKYPVFLNELLKDLDQTSPDVQSPHSLSKLGPNFERAHHSWHIVRLTNPDFLRPITFRAYIQCPKAFTVFPSQGYLRGGETVYVVLGVRIEGSLLNEAFETIDAEREQADPSFVTLNEKKGHLPSVPFVFRYMFAPCFPCLPHDYVARSDIDSGFPFVANPQPTPSKLQSIVDHLWDNVTAEADVRTIHISCHVNSNYGLDEFHRSTLMPFDLPMSKSWRSSNPSALPLTTVMPNLLERDKKFFYILQNLDSELEKSNKGDCYRSEKCCHICRCDWGPQSEILGRAYALRRLEIEKHELTRSRQQAEFFRTLTAIPLMLKRSLLDEEDSPRLPSKDITLRLNRILQLIYIMQADYLLQRRADRLVSIEDRELLFTCEQYLDDTYSDIQQCIQLIEHRIGESKDVKLGPWRQRGVYRNPRCVASVISGKSTENDTLFKPEPTYLQKFALMEHSIGGLNFGRQDDINHDDSQIYPQKQPSMHTDMFKNDAIKGLKSALAMIGKPESLMGHGIYDRAEKSGAVIRNPSNPLSVFFRTLAAERSRVNLTQQAVNLLREWALAGFQSIKRTCQNSGCPWATVNFKMNDPDPDGFSLVNFGANIPLNFQTTMAHYVCNIPLPGQGRLVLTSPRGYHEKESVTDILSLYTLVKPYSNIIFSSQEVQNNRSSPIGEASHGQINQQVQQPQPNAGEVNGIPELNIVWLIARHLGWTVDDDHSRGSILVDRRILIAVQWFSNSIMVSSLLGSLLSRKFKLVKTIPADFHFFDDHTKTAHSDMRFWTAEECGVAAVLVFGFYFVLGRLSERHVSRTYEREMRDDITERPPKHGTLNRFIWHVSHWAQILYNNSCPWMIQRHIFVPRWNRISRQETLANVSHHRSIDFREHRSLFNADNGRGRMLVSTGTSQLGFWSYSVGLGFALLSFSACSPHFVVNSLTVFCCSMAFGMSMSVESLENIRRTTSTGVLSVVKPRRLNTLVTGYILVGQLVGGSGGIIFLAEFIVTSIILILGGAATITSRAVECWITFVCLASTAFWGFVFARLGLLDTIRKRQRGVPSALLCASLCSVFVMWVGVFTRVDWQALTPGDLVMIQLHHLLSEIRERWWGN